MNVLAQFLAKTKSIVKSVPTKRLIVAETSTSMWNYHLREVITGQEKFTGGAGPALCLRELGWDTKIPLSTYVPGSKSHIPESFCRKCYNHALELGYQLPKIEN